MKSPCSVRSNGSNAIRHVLSLSLLVAWMGSVASAQETTSSSSSPIEPQVTAVNYTGVNNTALQGYVSMPNASSSNNNTSRLPAVIIIPDWDGVNEYEQVRATMVAQEWGYVGFAADVYGAEYHQVEGDMRGQMAGLYRDNPELFASRIQNAIAVVQNMTEVDPERIALVGYCLGGTGTLGRND
jgi:dienelactone hydrolase